MAELADAADSKSAGAKASWGFDSPSRHQLNQKSKYDRQKAEAPRFCFPLDVPCRIQTPIRRSSAQSNPKRLRDRALAVPDQLVRGVQSLWLGLSRGRYEHTKNWSSLASVGNRQRTAEWL